MLNTRLKPANNRAIDHSGRSCRKREREYAEGKIMHQPIEYNLVLISSTNIVICCYKTP